MTASASKPAGPTRLAGARSIPSNMGSGQPLESKKGSRLLEQLS